MQKPSICLDESNTHISRCAEIILQRITKRKRRRPRRMIGVVAGAMGILATAIGGMEVHGATVSWDSDGTGPNTGGTGEWNQTALLWDVGAGTYAPWSNAAADAAVFGG